MKPSTARLYGQRLLGGRAVPDGLHLGLHGGGLCSGEAPPGALGGRVDLGPDRRAQRRGRVG
ncbi:hypothetical protein ACFQ08_44675, partial [Streptosporangium algeriense]